MKSEDNKTKIDSFLLDIIACPSCKSSLKSEKNRLICSKCKKSYAIKDSIPYMLVK
jgi:uncharacterized protein YbaR (Trm112 family)